MMKSKQILVCLVLAGVILTSCASPVESINSQPGNAQPARTMASLPTSTVISLPDSTSTPFPSSTATAAHMPTVTPTVIPPVAPSETASPPSEAALQWLQTNAIGFTTAEPSTGCEDLQPLLAMIGEARLVALGEATHGTHEFFTMKQRITECLVQEKGFNLLALEAGWAEAEHINHEVVLGTETPDVVRSRYPYFMGSSELWDLIAWMQSYNQQAGESNQASLRGLDMQFGDLLVRDVLAYIQKVDPSSLGVVQDNLDCFLHHVKNYSANPGVELYSHAGEDIQAACREGLQAIYDLFLRYQSTYETASSPVEYAEAFAQVRLLIQNEQLMAEPEMPASINLRDRFMAENAAWLLEQARSDARMVIWAHNGHVTAARSFWTDAEAEAVGGAAGLEFIPMGAHLRELYGDALVVVGFAFNRGSFLAYGFSNRTNSSLGYRVYNLAGPLEGSYEQFLSTVSLPRLMLDLRLIQNDPDLADWFGEAHWMTSFGLGYVVDDPRANAVNIILPESFDILIYFETTTAAEQ